MRKRPAVSTDLRAEIIKAEGVTKRFGELIAVDRVDYLLHENEVAGIIGSNGAGKTTFFNLLTGYYPPDEGTIRYKGQDVTRKTPQERVALGMMRTFQLTSTFDNLSVIDNLVLSFFRAHKKSSLFHLLWNTCKRHRKDEKILAILETFNLQDVADRQVKNLSLGEKRRLEIAMAILAEPKVLLLDEPLAGLGESEIKGVLDVLRRHVGTQTILIVEHKISQVEDFLQRLTVMHDGRIIADGGYEECLRHPEVRRSYWQIDASAEGNGDGSKRGAHDDE
jgi:branched-chain amino acid transport system ATP-binding protein